MIVDGKKIASLIKENLKKIIKQQKLKKSLAIFYVGQNRVTDTFIGLKKRFGHEIGVGVEVFSYNQDVTEKELIEDIKKFSEKFDGVVVQLPLPEHLNKKNILNSIPKGKDVDVLSEERYADFKNGDLTFFPPVAGAVSEIFDFHNVSLQGKSIVVVGDGDLVGKPVLDWLRLTGFDPLSVNEHTKDKDEIYKNADVIISGVGKSSIIKKDSTKNGVVLIDAGSSMDLGKLVGDISLDCADQASLFSMVPGGVGPITIAVLFRNMLYN